MEDLVRPEGDGQEEASGTKPAGTGETVTGKLHIEYAFTGAAVVYLQPAKGRALTIISLIKAGAGATGVTLNPGAHTLTVSTTGKAWHLMDPCAADT